MGRIPRPQVLEELSKADFTVLMRSEEQRYAKAGFPTKFVESLATATPVIANSTSDLGMYLKDGENGYVVKGRGHLSGTPRVSTDWKAKYLYHYHPYGRYQKPVWVVSPYEDKILKLITFFFTNLKNLAMIQG
jgi:hypothetical protein